MCHILASDKSHAKGRTAAGLPVSNDNVFLNFFFILGVILRGQWAYHALQGCDRCQAVLTHTHRHIQMQTYHMHIKGGS